MSRALSQCVLHFVHFISTAETLVDIINLDCATDINFRSRDPRESFADFAQPFPKQLSTVVHASSYERALRCTL